MEKAQNILKQMNVHVIDQGLTMSATLPSGDLEH